MGCKLVTWQSGTLSTPSTQKQACLRVVCGLGALLVVLGLLLGSVLDGPVVPQGLLVSGILLEEAFWRWV